MKITKIKILGVGKMGSALVRSFSDHYQTEVFDKSPLAIQSITNELNDKILVSRDLSSILKSDQPLVLAVKPHQIQDIVKEIPNNRLIISIAAGVSLKEMGSWRTQKGPIVRAMPNMPIQIGIGMTCLMGNAFVNEPILQSVKDLFSHNSETIILKDEDLFDTVTALSGSGPALIYLFMQALEDAGVHSGLDRPSARKLVIQTALGSVRLAKESSRTPQDLIHDITSPGGTTSEAIASLKRSGFESSLDIAIRKAVKRSKKMRR